MFATLAPAATGIVVENRYDDPRMWGDRYQEFVYGAIGTGVAIGDFDRDGRPDVYVVSKTEGGRLFRNLGGWRFEDVTERAGVSGTATGWAEKAKSWIGLGDTSAPWFQGATFADVDNDGRLDLYVCRFGQPNLLYMNQGDGTFKEEAAVRGLAVSDASGVGAFCDYDRDGWLDVYVQTNLLDVAKQPEGQRDRLFRNNGDGKFTEVSDRAGIRGDTQGHSAIWWDFDNDGWPDLYVANDFAAPDSLYRNNRDGTFTDVLNSVVPLMPHSSMGADLGDVNNDGLIDFLVADMAATTHEKDQRGMATNRSRLDEMREPPGVAPQYMRNALYLNTGTGHMLEAAYFIGLAASDWTWSVRLEDLDNDGHIDAFFTNGMVRELNNVDLVARSSAAGSLVEKARVMKSSPPLAQVNLAFRNLGDPAAAGFENVSRTWGLDRMGVSFGAAFGDLDGDGDLDLVFVNYEGGVSVLRNDSDTGHRVIVALQGTRSNRFGVGATVRIESASGVQVRQLGVARGYLSSSEPVLHFGLGDDTLIERLVVEWPSGAVQTFADVPVDRKLTITEPASAPAELRRDEPDSATDRVNAELQTRTDPVEVSSGFGVPPLGGPGSAATKTQSRPMFSPMTAPPSFVPADPTRASADFDRDGIPDQFVGASALPGKYPLAGRSTLLAGRSNLEDMTDTLAPALREVGLVTAALWSDVDGDGWPDLVVAIDLGEIRYFHNNAGRGFEDWTERAGFASAGTGRWSALATADFNGDGRPDFVVGNLGLNTRYRASAQEPALLFFGDFGGGSAVGIEGHFEDGVLYPWLSRGEMEAKVSGLRRRFPRNDAYARASLGEIVGEERLAAARRFAVTELRSGVLLSQPDGSHRFAPLPGIAQIAPIRGIVAGDFDGDGAADIYAVQNSFEPPPSIGHFVGGLSQLLLGDGRGGFAAVPPAESGLIVPGEAVAVTVRDLDGDGRPDFVITRGDGSTIAFRNNGASDREATPRDAAH
ncbi:MAG TPA: VCBS repeat-containing protein [Opitutaceae bacterium]|nr:VCBS repeat-containing protein [Opitutaceae bacterium]